MRSAPEALEGDLEVLVEVLPGPKGGSSPTGRVDPTGPVLGDLYSRDDWLVLEKSPNEVLVGSSLK